MTSRAFSIIASVLVGTTALVASGCGGISGPVQPVVAASPILLPVGAPTRGHRVIIMVVDTSHSMRRLETACRTAAVNLAGAAALDSGRLELGAAARRGYGGTVFVEPFSFTTHAKNTNLLRPELEGQLEAAKIRIDALDELRVKPGSKGAGSDVTGMLSAAARRRATLPDGPNAPHDIVICSDGELVRPEGGFPHGEITRRATRRIIATDRRHKLLPSLAGVRLWIVGPGQNPNRANERNVQIEQFWRRYGAATGAQTTVLPDPTQLALPSG